VNSSILTLGGFLIPIENFFLSFINPHLQYYSHIPQQDPFAPAAAAA
jgi:hypothetical protein